MTGRLRTPQAPSQATRPTQRRPTARSPHGLPDHDRLVRPRARRRAWTEETREFTCPRDRRTVLTAAAATAVTAALPGSGSPASAAPVAPNPIPVPPVPTLPPHRDREPAHRKIEADLGHRRRLPVRHGCVPAFDGWRTAASPRANYWSLDKRWRFRFDPAEQGPRRGLAVRPRHEHERVGTLMEVPAAVGPGWTLPIRELTDAQALRRGHGIQGRLRVVPHDREDARRTGRARQVRHRTSWPSATAAEVWVDGRTVGEARGRQLALRVTRRRTRSGRENRRTIVVRVLPPGDLHRLHGTRRRARSATTTERAVQAGRLLAVRGHHPLGVDRGGPEGQRRQRCSWLGAGRTASTAHAVGSRTTAEADFNGRITLDPSPGRPAKAGTSRWSRRRIAAGQGRASYGPTVAHTRRADAGAPGRAATCSPRRAQLTRREVPRAARASSSTQLSHRTTAYARTERRRTTVAA